MQNIDIIILSNAQNEHLRSLTCQAIDSLLASEDPNEIRFHVLVIESAHVKPYSYPFCETFYPKTEFGYNKYMNIGLKKTSSPLVALCNNDLIFRPRWATEILRAFTRYPLMESASPLCEVNHVERGIRPNTGVIFGYEVRKEISGWCLFFKRDILKRTGPLEERLKFWFSDNDYAKTLEKHRILHGLVTDSLVDHLESQTLQTRSQRDQQKLTAHERFFFEYKWGQRNYFSYLNQKRKQFFNRL